MPWGSNEHYIHYIHTVVSSMVTKSPSLIKKGHKVLVFMNKLVFRIVYINTS